MEVENVLVSIIIVTFNCKNMVAALLDCFTESIYEIIVVDNNSIDGTVEYLTKICKDEKVIRLPKNVGFGAANNIGASIGKGEYLLFLNPDILLPESAIQGMCEYLSNNINVAVVGCKLKNNDGSLQLSCHREPTLLKNIHSRLRLEKIFSGNYIGGYYNYSYWDHNEIKEVDYVCGAAFMIRKNDFINNKGFDEKYFLYCEEVDLCKRLRKKGRKIIYLPYIEMTHYSGGSTGKKSKKIKLWEVESNYLFLKKHYGILQSLIFITIMILEYYLRSIIDVNNIYPNILELLSVLKKKNIEDRSMA
jgi:hypothetical protein